MAWPDLRKFVQELFRKGPEHLEHGRVGEAAAKNFLRKAGLKYLCANYSVHDVGEIDLIFRDGDCLVFVEVKARSNEDWTRPAAAVNRDKRERLVKMSLRYRRLLPNPYVKYRYDIVEVLLKGGRAEEVRHIVNAFNDSLEKR